MLRFLISVVALLAPLLCGLSVAAAPAQHAAARADGPAAAKVETKANDEAKAKKPAEPRGKLAVTPEREAAVLTFVERNHPELATLLQQLKETRPKEYERAVRELFRASERLANLQDRDAKQYGLELQLWTVQSRIQLLAARLKMGATDELRSQMKQLLGEELDARTALLHFERDRVAKRLDRLDGDLKKLHDNREQMLDKQLQSLASAPASLKKNKKADARRNATPASKTPATAEKSSKAADSVDE